MKKVSISVLIHTLNEENNIRDCLETVKWAEEIIVVDMYSDDNTINIAKQYTDKIFLFEKMGYADPARQFALDKASKEWVLVVDADERIPKKFMEKIDEVISKNLGDVIYVPRNNYFFGKLMKGTCWGALQDIQPRLFKKSYVSFSPSVHNIFKINSDAKIYYINNPEEGFIHFNYIDLEHFIEKFNRYTTIEALNTYEGLKNPPSSIFKELILITKEIISRYVLHKGYKDQYFGLYLSLLMGMYKVVSFFKYKLMYRYKTKNVKDVIKDKYNMISKKIIDEYNNEHH
jgi:glycosyltransferase involved in cell wall biosynthesis